MDVIFDTKILIARDKSIDEHRFNKMNAFSSYKFEVGANDYTFSGNEQQKVYNGQDRTCKLTITTTMVIIHSNFILVSYWSTFTS